MVSRRSGGAPCRLWGCRGRLITTHDGRDISSADERRPGYSRQSLEVTFCVLRSGSDVLYQDRALIIIRTLCLHARSYHIQTPSRELTNITGTEHLYKLELYECVLGSYNIRLYHIILQPGYTLWLDISTAFGGIRLNLAHSSTWLYTMCFCRGFWILVYYPLRDISRWKSDVTSIVILS